MMCCGKSSHRPIVFPHRRNVVDAGWRSRRMTSPGNVTNSAEIGQLMLNDRFNSFALLDQLSRN